MASVLFEHRRLTRRTLPVACVGLLAAVVSAGCTRPQPPPTDSAALEEQIAILESRLAAAEATVSKLQAEKREHEARDNRAKELAEAAKAEFVVREITLGGFTGGKNWDGKPGDDGLRVYLYPIDRDGHTIKRIGEITLELYDLALEDRHPRIGAWHFAPQEAARQWKSNALYYGYYFQLQWQSIVPAHADLELRAEFVALDGTKHTARRSFTVDLPPGPE